MRASRPYRARTEDFLASSLCVLACFLFASSLSARAPLSRRKSDSFEKSIMPAMASSAWSQVQPRAHRATLINMEEAEILIYVMPDAQAERKSGKDVAWSLETNPEYDLKNFYYFWVVGTGDGESHHEGSITVGYFAVNKHTGDVWEYATMEHINSPQLEGVQKIILKHHDIDSAVLRKYGGLRPRI
jgi:hypothetical protein